MKLEKVCVCVTAVLKEWGLQMTSFHLIIAIKTTTIKKGATKNLS